MIQNVTHFNQINLRQRMLVLCDIDDTVFDYGKPIEDYWNSKIDDPGYRILIEQIKKLTPKLTDDNFNDFILNLNSINCEIHFVTHRNPNFKDITHNHLNFYGIFNIPIHFLAGESKSEYINRTFNLNDYEGIIFIDDSQFNVDRKSVV